MLFILGLRYRSHYRSYSYKFFVKQLYFLEIQMVCFVLFQCEISYSKLTSCKSIDVSKPEIVWNHQVFNFLVFLVFVFLFIRSSYYYHADLFMTVYLWRKWIYEVSFIWTAEKDMKTWLIIAIKTQQPEKNSPVTSSQLAWY